eukprot:TRINITY_DN114851_c0_g1_i1.p1 TRINITY_DN114851_c0_g1~~TRINITY_DN114851_c0_g1_i1.p1  ORF type:complete len:308 (-),score=67.16 TRINITY_DN114851_c0_g1_i1:110-967(-)
MASPLGRQRRPGLLFLFSASFFVALFCSSRQSLSRKPANFSAANFATANIPSFSTEKPPLALIFDCDGTLVDTETPYWKALNNAIFELSSGKSSGVSSKEEWGEGYSGTGLEKCADKAIADFDLKCSQAEFMHLWLKRFSEMIAKPGSITLNDGFDELYRYARQQGLKVAVASSSDGAGLKQKLLNGVISHSKVVSKIADFDVVVSNDDVRNHKPHPEIYLLAAKRLGVPADRCIVIEDTATGALAGKRAGMKVLAVPNQYTQGTNDFSFTHAVLDSLNDAVKFF